MESLAEAQRVVDAVREALADGAFPTTEYIAPPTYTAANALVQQREDAKGKRRDTAKKDGRGKSRSPTPQSSPLRGVIPGAEDDRTPYWMIMEVSDVPSLLLGIFLRIDQHPQGKHCLW